VLANNVAIEKSATVLRAIPIGKDNLILEALISITFNFRYLKIKKQLQNGPNTTPSNTTLDAGTSGKV